MLLTLAIKNKFVKGKNAVDISQLDSFKTMKYYYKHQKYYKNL